MDHPGKLVSSLKGLDDSALMKELETLRGGVIIKGYRSRVPEIKKDPSTYKSNLNLVNDCETLPISEALKSLKDEFLLILKENPYVFSFTEIKCNTDNYDYFESKKIEQDIEAILFPFTKAIITLIKRFIEKDRGNSHLNDLCKILENINIATDQSISYANTDTIIINQAEAGISKDKPLSTTGVGDCICLAIKDEETGRVLFSHVDIQLSEKSITECIKKSFPNSSNLKIRLFGGIKAKSKYNNKSMSNVVKIIKALPNEARIISADIANTDLDQERSILLSPTFTVIPDKFEVDNSCPISFDNDISLINSIPIDDHGKSNKYKHNLYRLYDNNKYIPILMRKDFLSKNYVINQKNYLEEIINLTKIYDESIRKLNFMGAGNLLLTLLFDKSVGELIEHSKEVASFKNKSLDQDELFYLEATLKNIDLHIGNNSFEGNHEIVTFIDNNLFKEDGSLDLEGLEKIEMKPYSPPSENPKEVLNKTQTDDVIKGLNSINIENGK